MALTVNDADFAMQPLHEPLLHAPPPDGSGAAWGPPAGGKAIAERVFALNRMNAQGTEIVLRFPDEDIRRLDRPAFRQLVSEQLNAVGDALLAAWDKQHGEAGA